MEISFYIISDWIKKIVKFLILKFQKNFYDICNKKLINDVVEERLYGLF